MWKRDGTRKDGPDAQPWPDEGCALAASERDSGFAAISGEDVTMTRNRFVIAVAAGAILGGAMGPGADAQTSVPARDLARARPPALRPAVAGPNGGISTGHPLTSAAALEILLKGGNAFDAGAAILLVGGVVEQDL
jgi:hypothetical protein